MENVLKIKKIAENVITPKYMTDGAAGFDIHAYIPHIKEVCMEPGDSAIIPTGLFFEVPIGYEAQVRPRSGMAFKYGISIPNSPGTIDSDYRGEVKVCLINLGKESYTVKDSDRIAQVIISAVSRFDINVVEDLSETKRGEGGFGHTGVS